MNLDLFDNTERQLMREPVPEMRTVPPADRTPGISPFPKNTPLGIAYVPFQQWGEVYPEDDAFQRGTLFPQLDFPFRRGGKSDE